MEGKKDDDYIKDGLVFHLDGINRGTTDADKWVDLVGGKVFKTSSGNDATWGSNYLITPNTMKNSDMIAYTPSGYTCEIVYRFDVAVNQSILLSRLTNNNRSQGGYCFGLYNNNFLLTNNSNAKLSVAKTTMPVGSDYCVSFYYPSKVFVNGVQKTAGTADYYYSPSDGSVSIGGYNSGRLYALRIYNRQLSLDEILHNQQLDNQRFNLGLTI